MKKIEEEKMEENEMKWKVEDAIRNFTEYKKAIENEKIREAVITELKKRSKEYKELSEEL